MHECFHVAAGAVLVLLLGCVRPAAADQTDPKLDRLFLDLKAAATVEAARPVEAEIWGLWSQSHDDAVDRTMAEGGASLAAGDYAAAVAAFDRVVARSPGFAEGWNKRATALYLLGRFAESERDIARVLALEPRHFGALSGLGMCELQLNRTRKALEALERAQAVDPNLPGIADNIHDLKTRIARESI